MGLNFYIDEVRDFIDKSGFVADYDKIFAMLDEEFSALKSANGDAEKMQHQVYDMLFLLFEIAAKGNFNLDTEWEKGRERKKKYLSTDSSVIVYNKLVRDEIPAICEASGLEAVTRELTEEEYIESLSDKLKEECDEYVESKNTEELADILEVIHAICKNKGIEIEDVEKVRVQKKKRRGGFDNRLLLIETKKKQV